MAFPLHDAARHGQLPELRGFLQQGYDANLMDVDGLTPLQRAADPEHGHSEEVEEAIDALVRAGATVDLRSKTDFTPLVIAARQGQTNAVVALLRADADPHADCGGKTPTEWAQEKGHIKIPELIRRHLAQKEKFPLHDAARHGRREELVELLRAVGAVPDLINDDGLAPMHLAARYGQASAILALGQAPHPSSCRARANPDLADKHGATPLYLAAKEGRTAAVKALLSEHVGASANVFSKDPILGDVTPVFIAAYHGHRTVIEELVRVGRAKVTIKRPPPAKALAALDIARERHHKDAAKFLEDPLAALCKQGATVGEMIAVMQANPNVPQAVLLDGRDLGDAGVAAALRELYGSEVAIRVTRLDVSGNRLSTVPSVESGLCQLRSLQSLQLRSNDISELPLQLTELHGLTQLDVRDNPRLASEAQKAKGVPDIFKYIRDLHDNPTPCFVLKLALIGPSMGGKSSLLRALPRDAHPLTDATTKRTIGLDITRVVLSDPNGRAPQGIRFVCYDSSGHDQHKDIQVAD
jgi:ankyrin repeat protein